MKSNPAPDPKKSHKSAGSDSENPDPEQHCSLPRLSMASIQLPEHCKPSH